MTRNDLKMNIKRLENTIKMNCWNKGYVRNCEADMKIYKEMLNKVDKKEND